MRHSKGKSARKTAKPLARTLSTTPTQTISPASIVFGIFELLENILLNLPLEDILLVSNTCNSARLVVENSTPITNRFRTQDGGYEVGARLVAGDSWSNDISFAVLFELDCAKQMRGSCVDMFVSQKDECEAIAILDFHGTGRLQIVNGVNMKVNFTRPVWNKWRVEIYDVESGHTMAWSIEPDSYCSLPEQGLIDLERYLIRFHGGTGYDDCDDIMMMGRLVRGVVHF